MNQFELQFIVFLINMKLILRKLEPAKHKICIILKRREKMLKKISFPIIFTIVIGIYFNSTPAYSQAVGVYVRTPSFVFTAGTPRYIIANDYPYSCWPYVFFPPLRVGYRHHHHHYYYRHPVYYQYRHDYGRHRGWYKHGRHHRD